MAFGKKKSGDPVVIKTNFRRVKLHIKGESPLLVHAFSEKAKRQMLDAMQGRPKQKEDRDPQADFLGAQHRLSDGRHGFPATGLKGAIVGAARQVDGLTMTVLKTSFNILADDAATGLLAIIGPEPRMREDTCPIGPSRVMDLRYRPEYWPWSMEAIIDYNSSSISLDQLALLCTIAGFGVGLGEWRPERDGTNGRFSLKHVEHMGAIDPLASITGLDKKTVQVIANEKEVTA